MLGLDPKDFKDYHTYEINRARLERAQRTAVNVYDAIIGLTNCVEEDSMLDLELIRMIQNAVQIGYEEAIGLPHKSSDYDVDDVTVGDYVDRCKFCKHVYYVYGCEENCALKTKGLECKLEIKEFLE